MTFNIYLPDNELLIWLQEKAEKEKRSVSYIIRQIIKKEKDNAE